jgi:hypothetical protein
VSTAIPPRPRRDAATRGGVAHLGEHLVYLLDLPGTPPSFNKVGLHSHWTQGRKAKQDWQGMIETMLMVEKVPRGMSSVAASAELHFKQKRKRDEGNFRTILEKACGDALVRGGWLTDDQPEFYRFGAVEMRAPYEVANTIIRLDFLRA